MSLLLLIFLTHRYVVQMIRNSVTLNNFYKLLCTTWVIQYLVYFLNILLNITALKVESYNFLSVLNKMGWKQLSVVFTLTSKWLILLYCVSILNFPLKLFLLSSRSASSESAYLMLYSFLSPARIFRFSSYSLFMSRLCEQNEFLRLSF